MTGAKKDIHNSLSRKDHWIIHFKNNKNRLNRSVHSYGDPQTLKNNNNNELNIYDF
jgi:hypothetical protein